MPALRRRDRLAMAMRASLLQATFNYERQQGLGWAWSLAPALRRVVPDEAQRRERLVEHTGYFNTQPTLASLALGVVATLEERRAAGEPVDAESIRRTKAVLGSSLAALGDRLFWFTLRPLAACVGVLVTLAAGWLGAPALWLCYNLVHQSLRLRGVGWGYRRGPEVLDDRLRRQLGGLVRFGGIVGSIVAGITVAELLVPGGQPRPIVYQAALAAGLGAGLVAARRPRPSPTEWALGIGALCLVAAAWTG